MPKWVHDRAKHIREKNPDMPESQSWALATQQAYAAGKAPKDYGSKEGKKEALEKYDDPKSTYKKTADPQGKTKTSGLSLALLSGFSDELIKIAMTSVSDITKKVTNSIPTSKPKLVSKPMGFDLKTPGSDVDHLESKSIPSPPV